MSQPMLVLEPDFFLDEVDLKSSDDLFGALVLGEICVFQKAGTWERFLRDLFGDLP